MERTPRLHALLIGIDAYALPEQRLRGCVRDIDGFAAYLRSEVRLDGLELSIELLTARTNAPPDANTPTRRRIITALSALAGERTSPGDRVLVYYAGHGARIYFPKAEADYEALVPADYSGQKEQLLFDYEINGLLAAIAEHTGDLTVILDCCNSGGLTRFLREDRAARSRYIRIEANREELPPALPQNASRGLLRTSGPGRTYCVVAACQANQTALELSFGADGSETHGLLSYSLLTVLRGPFQDRIATTRWADLWEPLRAEMSAHHAEQQPLLLGPSERFLLGGPSTPFSPGLVLRQEPDGGLVLGVGLLGGISEGALIGVYPPTEPALFAPLDSTEDLSHRLGHLIVRSADAISAVLAPDSTEPPALPVPRGARARLVRPAEEELLRVFCEPEVPHWVGEVLSGLRSACRLVPEVAAAELRIGQSASGDLLLGDSVYPHRADRDACGLAPLARIPLGLQIPNPALREERRSKALVSAVQHYAGYVLPLRISQQPGTIRPAGALSLELIDCGTPSAVAAMRADVNRRRTIPLSADGTCTIRSESQCCFYAHNGAWSGLYVTVLVCSSEGWVELLSEPVHIDSMKGTFLWDYSENRPLPFKMSCGDRTCSIDRVIAIGCSSPRMDVRSLRQQLAADQEASLQALIDEVFRTGARLFVRRTPRALECTTATLNVKLIR